ncbi:MAG: hypothetical protein WAW96_18235 [Alphaproteobacteria bacterium]
MLSSILKRAVAPIIVAVMWIVAIFTMASEPVGGLEPLFAGLIGGAAFFLQACTIGARGVRQVFGLRAPVAAGGALLAFVFGVALIIVVDPVAAAQPFFRFGQIAISAAGTANFLVRLGIALAIAAVVAQASLSLFDDGGART